MSTFLICLSNGIVHAQDEIAIYNLTNKYLHGALYYVKGEPNGTHFQSNIRASDSILLPPFSMRSIMRPGRKYYYVGVYNRYLCVSEDESHLTDLIVTGTYTYVNVGNLQGNQFYLDDRDGILQGFNRISWNARILQEAVEAVMRVVLQEVRAQYSHHDYSNIKAVIRQGNDIASEEKAYVEQRLPVIKKALEQLLHTSIANHAIPRIAWCGSGGGYRAMLATLGSLKGAEQCGLFNASMCASGVSGSTWALASLIQSKLSVAHYINRLVDHIGSPRISADESDQITDALLKQFAFTQYLSLIDFCGALLAQRLLKCTGSMNPHDIDIAAHARAIQPATTLFPIYTAIVDRGDDPYAWIEFTPYEVGSTFLKTSIPIWALGRRFCAGDSADFNPPQSLSFCMGIWGSAISANLKEIIELYKEKIQSTFITHSLISLVQEIPSITEGRVASAYVYNWNYHTTLPFSQHEYIRLLDAGIDCNIPLVPLLREERKIDIIIILDATDGVKDAPELRKAEAYAQLHHLPFPPINYAAVNTFCSVHADWDNPHVPVIIYLPLMKQPDYFDNWDPYQPFTSTFNFAYTRDKHSCSAD